MKNFFVYIIKNKKNILYTGITKDIVRRINEHNIGKGAKFTRGRGPWKLIYTEGPLKHGDAIRREIEIKKDRFMKSKFKNPKLD